MITAHCFKKISLSLLAITSYLFAASPMLDAATIIANSDATVGTITAGTPTIYIDGGDANFETADGVIWDGTIDYAPNNFNNNLVNSGPTDDGNTLSSFFFSGYTLQLSDIPVITRNNVDYFAFVMDAQETGGNGLPLLSTDMTINIHTTAAYNDPTAVWTNLYAVQINGNLPTSEDGVAQNGTKTPLGQGGDLLILVPLSIFYGYSTDDYFEWVVTQEDSDNGDDEWALAPGTTFFDSGITLEASLDPPAGPPTPPSVPEPSSVLLMLLAGVSALTHRRR